jgi:hypothetical protein
MVHQDQVNVESLPKDFINIGVSKMCDVQGVYQRGRVLTYQGHAELNREMVLDFLKPISGEESVKESMKENLKASPDDRTFAALIILKFFREEAVEEAAGEGVVEEVVREAAAEEADEEVEEEVEEAVEEEAEETVGDGELIEEVAWDTLCGLFNNMTVEARGEYVGDSGAGEALGDTDN